jgi:hypothetical protein
LNRQALGHEKEKHGDMAARIGQQQRGRHGPDYRPPHAQAGMNLPCGDWARLTFR